jgi:hypothetical protein
VKGVVEMVEVGNQNGGNDYDSNGDEVVSVIHAQY